MEPVYISVTMDGAGLINYLRATELPDDGLSNCDNAYSFRKRLVKRGGYSLLGTLGISEGPEVIGGAAGTTVNYTTVADPIVPGTLSITDSAKVPQVMNDNYIGQFWQPAVTISGIKNASSAVVTAASVSTLNINDTVTFFNIGGMTELNSVTGAYDNAYTVTNVGAGNFTINVDSTDFHAYTSGGTYRRQAGSIDYETGVLTAIFPNAVTGAVSVSYQAARGNPVVGLWQYDTPGSPISALVAFDTQRAYEFDTGTQTFLDITGSNVWTGSVTSFIQAVNYQGLLFATNNKDAIQYYNGSTWTAYTPTITMGVTLQKCLWLIPFKGYFLAFAPTEAGTVYPQRVRWSWNGSVTDSNAWNGDNANGGFTDAGTGDVIVDITPYKDLIIVGFSNSKWRLRFTGSNVQEFVWEQINSSLGSQSTFGAVFNDEFTYSVGAQGIVKSDFNNAARMDIKIPDLAFEFSTLTSKSSRVQAQRDFLNQLIYWIYPDDNADVNSTPNRMLIYNYLEDAWATSTPANTFNCLGQFEQFEPITWLQMTQPWSTYTLPWTSYFGTAGTPTIVAGDTHGNVYAFAAEDATDNGVAFSPDIISKAYNPFYDKGYQCRLSYVDFVVDATSGGAFSVDFCIGDDPIPVITKIVSTVANTQGGNTRTYRTYVNLSGDFITMNIYLSAAQLADPTVSISPINIRRWGMQFYAGARL